MIDKKTAEILDCLDADNPYATYLNNNAISVVSGWIDTGSYVLNGIISGSLYGGIPRNRMTMLAGPSMCGKSYIIQKILANAQKQGLIPVIFDSENAIDAKGAIALGLDPSKVKYVPVFSLEQCRNEIYKFLTKAKEANVSDKFIIAIDSLGNLESELQIGRMEKNSLSADMGSRAKAVKSLLRTCTSLAALTKTTIIVSNHIYEDPSAMFPSLEKQMPGGKAAVYLPSVTLQLARKPMKEDKETEGTLAVGQKSFPGVILRALTVKNRFVKQYLEGEIYLSFAKGLNKYYGLAELAVGLKVLTQSGPSYGLPSGEKLGYYSKWKGDEELWQKTILPGIEQAIKKEWVYGNKEGEEEEPGDSDVEVEENEDN